MHEDYDDMFADQLEQGYDDSMDGDHESALASAGWGVDESYVGWDGDSWYEEQYDLGDE